MAAKTGKLTANRARKEKFLRRDFGNLEVQMGVGDVTFPIVVLGITDLATIGGRGHGIASVSRQAPALASKSAFSFPGKTCVTGDLLEAQGGVVGEGGREGPNIPE